MPSESSPIILRGSRLTTKSAWRPTISCGFGALLLHPGEDRARVVAEVDRQSQEPVGLRDLLDPRIVPTRTSIASRAEKGIGGLTGAGDMA